MYSISWPFLASTESSAERHVLWVSREGSAATGTVTVFDGGEASSVPPGALARAVAVFTTSPASTSACVSV